jgi:hypothetical protein
LVCLRTADDVVAARHQVRPGSYLTAYREWPRRSIEDASENRPGSPAGVFHRAS